MNSRIKQIRESFHLNQTEFGARIGLKQSSITGYESGNRKPNNAVIKAICNEFQINEEWLKSGIGPMKKEDDSKEFDLIIRPYSDDLSSEDKMLITKYLQLSKAERETVLNFIRSVANELNSPQSVVQKPENAEKGSDSRLISSTLRATHRDDGFTHFTVFEQAAAAGIGNYLDDNPPYHIEQYPDELVPSKTDFGVVISGSSMEPVIPNGCTVFVQSTSFIDPGEIGIFVYDGKAYCKQLLINREHSKVILHSLNPEVQDIEVEMLDELRTLGRVIGHY